MHYLIDYDTRTVEFQHGNRKELEQYITANDLDLAVGIVSSWEDLEEQLTRTEITEFYETIELETMPFADIHIMAKALWETIIDDQFTTYTKAKGKQAVKANPPNLPHQKSKAENEPSPAAKQKSKPNTNGDNKPAKNKPKSANNKPKPAPIKDYKSKTFSIGTTPAKSGTVHGIFVTIIEDNLGEADFKTLAEQFEILYTKKDNMTEAFIWSYLKGAINTGRITIE